MLLKMKKFTDKTFYLRRIVEEVYTTGHSIAKFLDKIRKRTRSQNFSDSPYAPYTGGTFIHEEGREEREHCSEPYLSTYL